MNKKMFMAFDIDFTLTNDQGAILPETISAITIAQEAGHICSIVTGRPSTFVKQLKGTENFDYILTSNGSVIEQKDVESSILSWEVKPDVARFALTLIHKFGLVGVVHIADSAPFVIYNPPVPEERTFNGHEKLVAYGYIPITEEQMLEKIDNGFRISQMTVKPVDEVADDLYAYIEEKGMTETLTRSKNRIFDFKPVGINKATAIKHLLDHENISDVITIGYGDSMNDFEMMKSVDIGIAMGNSEEELKQVATEVIGTNNEPSLSKKILELMEKYGK